MTREELQAAVVKIITADGTGTAGTGFVVSPVGLVMTSAHVVLLADSGPGGHVKLVFIAAPNSEPAVAQVDSKSWRPPGEGDIALLRIEGVLPNSVQVVEFGDSTGIEGQRLYTFGFPSKGPLNGTWGVAEVVGRSSDQKHPLLQVKSQEISPGYSGGPLWHEASGYVVGMNESILPIDEFHRHRETAWAIPSEMLEAALSELAQIPPRQLANRHALTGVSHTKAKLQVAPSPFETERARGQQMEDTWTRYFHQRVVNGLFVEPHTFEKKLELFRRAPAIVEGLIARLRQMAVELPQKLAPPQRLPLSVSDITSNFGFHLSRCADFIVTSDRAALILEISAVKKSLDLVEDRFDNLQEKAISDDSVDAADDYEETLSNVRWQLEEILDESFRAVASLWFLVAPAGRGKSTFVWEVAKRLRDAGELLCVLTGPDLDGITPIEQVLLTALHVAAVSPATFEDAGAALWKSRQRPLFVLVDAINESRADLGQVANQLSKLFSIATRNSWMRLLVTCRDMYWQLVFQQEFDGFLAGALVETQESVVPRLNTAAIRRYLAHYSVSNVASSDLRGGEWEANPLVLRIFCEAYRDGSYEGPKPIRMSAFRLLREYFARKQKELARRTFGTLDLQMVLDRVARVMLRQGRALPGDSSIPRFAVAELEARGLLAQKSRSGEDLYDVLIDMDLVFQIELSQSATRYVTFTFERMQDYFLGRVLLQRAEEQSTRIDDEYVEGLRTEGVFSESAIGTALALSIDQGTNGNLSDLTSAIGISLPVILDLVEPQKMQSLRKPLLDGLGSEQALDRLRYYLRGQLQSQSSERRAFAESFGVGLLADAVWRLELKQRHRQFYNDRDLVDAMADVLEGEIERMRDWVRSRFNSFPQNVEADDGRLRAVALLLGTNSPQVRDIAHEWLFWFGHFMPKRVCELVESYLFEEDLLIRERIIALLHALLLRHPDLAVPERLLKIHAIAFNRNHPKYSEHYIVREFSRKTLVMYRAVVGDHFPVAEWNRIDHPPRKRTRRRGDRQHFFSKEPQWRVREPIHGDQSRYTFGIRFSGFAVPDRDVAVQEALVELPRIGYEASFYEGLDSDIAKSVDNPRHWGGSRRRYERFGKTYAYVASWIILGRWAESKPIADSIKNPEAFFALDHPEYDYFFSVDQVVLPSSSPPAVLDFPETMSWLDWEVHDESVYLHQFVDQFSDEAVIWGLADRTKGDRRLRILTKCVLIRQDMVNAYAWAVNRLQKLRADPLGRLDEEYSEDFEFHALGQEPIASDPFAGRQSIVAAFSERTRTLNNQDRTVITVSARVIRAGNLRQLETLGEFADESGRLAVRNLSWGEIGSEHYGRLVLMRREILAECCRRMPVSYGFFDCIEVWGVDARGQYDNKHMIGRWTARFPDAAPPLPWIETAFNDWEQKQGVLRLGLDDLVRCYSIAQSHGRDALDEELERLLVSNLPSSQNINSFQPVDLKGVDSLIEGLMSMSDDELRKFFGQLKLKRRRSSSRRKKPKVDGK